MTSTARSKFALCNEVLQPLPFEQQCTHRGGARL